MYANIEIPVKCSKCGAINNYEDVIKQTYKKTMIRRCLNCGHESVLVTISVFPEDEIGFVEYTAKYPEFNEF